MASFKCFVPLMLCVLLAVICTASAKPLTEESDKKSVQTTPSAEADEVLKKKLKAKLDELERDVDDFLAKIDKLDAELDEVTVIPDKEEEVTANIQIEPTASPK